MKKRNPNRRPNVEEAIDPYIPDGIEEINLDKPDPPAPPLPGVYLVTPDMTLAQAKALIKEQGFLYNSLPDYFKTAEMLEIANTWWMNHFGNQLTSQGQLPQQHCLRCYHQWTPRKLDIRFCPKCHSGYWDRPFPEKKPKTKAVVKQKAFPIKPVVRKG